jgi:hypothetical protein
VKKKTAKKPARKIELHRETLRTLESFRLGDAAGGFSHPTCGATCQRTCVTACPPTDFC